jgi:hypothetical protein
LKPKIFFREATNRGESIQDVIKTTSSYIETSKKEELNQKKKNVCQKNIFIFGYVDESVKKLP